MIPPDFFTWLTTPRRRPLVMGVLNVTPDSFSDGGRFLDPAAAVAEAERMAADGADLIDVGGESTRPGADPVSEEEQIARVAPVIAAIRHLPITISIDTTRAAVAAAALDAGAVVVNDVTAGRDDPDLLPLCAETGAPVVLMHMLGEPKSMQVAPTYVNVVGEVRDFLLDRANAAEALGVKSENILLDVGIGFGKTGAHNLALLQELETFTALPYPHLAGVSRKRFIGEITGEPVAANRQFGTAAAVAWAVARGAGIVRVHDVRAMRQVVDMTEAIRTAGLRPY